MQILASPILNVRFYSVCDGIRSENPVGNVNIENTAHEARELQNTGNAANPPHLKLQTKVILTTKLPGLLDSKDKALLTVPSQALN